jgi:hypothetical protein
MPANAGTPPRGLKLRNWLSRSAYGLFWLFAFATVAVVVCSIIWFEQSFYDNWFFWVFFGLAAIFAFMSRRLLAVALTGASVLLIVWDLVRPSYDELLTRGAWHFVLWLALGVTAAVIGYCFGGAIGKRLEENLYYRPGTTN